VRVGNRCRGISATLGAMSSWTLSATPPRVTAKLTIRPLRNTLLYERIQESRSALENYAEHTGIDSSLMVEGSARIRRGADQSAR